MIGKIHYLLLVLTLCIALLDLDVRVTYPHGGSVEQPDLATKVTLSFSGDIIQHRPQMTAAQTANGSYDFSGNFAHIDTVWRSVDFAIVNYETTVSVNGKHTGFPLFSAPDDVAKHLYNSGVRYLGLANNHCCDKGMAGIKKSLASFDSIGFRHTGLYADSASSTTILMLNKGIFRIALLNYTYSTNGIPIPRGARVNLIDTVKMLRDITRARADSAATHVVAFMHWGVEYQRKANAAQKQIGLWLRHNGVDVVVGSHPHVVQQIDTVNRIVYSLGNFISNQQDRYTDSGITVKLTFERSLPPVIEFIPHWCDKFAPTRAQKYRVLTERDTILINNAAILTKFKNALIEAREAVGSAKEFQI